MSERRIPEPRGTRAAFPYPRKDRAASTGMTGFLREGIEETGTVGFQEFMRESLYHPEFGYYARPAVGTVGKRRDFITSVSVGRCFGLLVAERLRAFWKERGRPEEFTVFEMGAHDGSLARDILRAAEGGGGEFAEAVRYAVVEPLAGRREFLAEGIGREYPGGKVEILAAWPGEERFGALVANELLDALPVPLFHFDGGEWRELAVAWNGERFIFAEMEEKAHVDFLAEIGTDFPAGYVCEGPPDFRAVLERAARVLKHGLMLFFDYGFDQETLLNPGRTGGSLRAYAGQRTGLHPLDDPGGRDLTAHVNFTQLGRALDELGFETSEPMAQGRWLTYAGREWLMKEPHDPSLIRQFQTLTHPSQFGTAFSVVEARFVRQSNASSER